MRPRWTVWTLGVAIATVSACVAGQSGAPGPAPAAVGGKPSLGSTGLVRPKRLARPVADPLPGRSLKVARYWAFGPDAPYEISRVELRTEPKLGADGTVITTMKGEVQLLAGKALKGTKASRRLLQAQDPAAESSALPVEQEAEATQPEAGAPSPEASPSADGTDAAASEAGDVDPALPELAGSAPVEPVDPEDLWAPDDGLPTASQEEPAPEEAWTPLDEAADDVPDEGEDYVEVDADGSYQGNEPASTLDLPREQLKGLLAPSHPVSMVIHTPFMMSDQDTVLELRDERTGEQLKFTYDAAGRQARFLNARGTLVLERNPDGTVMVDGKGLSGLPAAAYWMRQSPVVKQGSAALFNFLLARMDRMSHDFGRGPHRPPPDDSRFPVSGEAVDRAQSGNGDGASQDPAKELVKPFADALRTATKTNVPVFIPTPFGNVPIITLSADGINLPRT